MGDCEGLDPDERGGCHGDGFSLLLATGSGCALLHSSATRGTRGPGVGDVDVVR